MFKNPPSEPEYAVKRDVYIKKTCNPSCLFILNTLHELVRGLKTALKNNNTNIHIQ